MDPELEQPGFLQKYKFTLISLFIILLAAIPLLLLSNKISKKTAVVPVKVNVTPTTTPLTTKNVEPTLTQTDANIQTTLNQMDTDLQSVSKIDTSQDSTAGL